MLIYIFFFNIIIYLYFIIKLALVKFIKEMFKCEISGKCERFQSVAGCGIKCIVSHIDDLFKTGIQSEFIMNYHNHIKLVVS